MSQLYELDPGLDRGDRAGRVRRAATHLDFSPSGFAAQGDEHPLVEDINPAAPVFGLVCLQIQADDLGASKTTGKADKQHRPIPQAAQRAAIERLDHGDDILCHHRLFLHRRPGMAVANSGHHRRNVPVPTIKGDAALRIIPR